MENDSLATELLHTLKASIKRLYIVIIILILLLFGSNMAWLYAWNLLIEETTTTVTSDNDSNANYINGEGDITNCGKN